MQLFYDPDLKAGLYALRPAEAIHAARVLRKRVGEELDLVDGKGGWYTGTISAISKRECTLEVRKVKQEARRAGHLLTLLVAPTKNIDRFEWILEKCTEIGIDRIQPIFSEHSERKRLRGDRLERVFESAMKQSLRAWLPELSPPLPFAEAIEAEYPGDRYLAYLGERGKTPLLSDRITGGRSCVIAIGPEGGFSKGEAEAARAAEWQWVSLGPNRLRTETAAIAAVHTIESRNW